MEHAEHDEKHTCHQRGDGQTLKAILLDDAIYNNNERARRTTDLNLRTSEHRNEQTSYDGRDDTLLRGHARGDTKGNGQWQCHDANDDTSQQVGRELLTVIVPESREQLGFKCQCIHLILHLLS